MPTRDNTNQKNELYKSKLCNNHTQKGTCPYGSHCQFAHGKEELRSFNTSITSVFEVDLSAHETHKRIKAKSISINKIFEQLRHCDASNLTFTKGILYPPAHFNCYFNTCSCSTASELEKINSSTPPTSQDNVSNSSSLDYKHLMNDSRISNEHGINNLSIQSNIQNNSNNSKKRKRSITLPIMNEKNKFTPNDRFKISDRGGNQFCFAQRNIISGDCSLKEPLGGSIVDSSSSEDEIAKTYFKSDDRSMKEDFGF